MNRIIIHCGNGRGKSSSGFGVVVRALAHGRKVLVVQFFKPEMDAALKYLLENSDGRLTVKNYGSWYFKDRPDVDAALVYQNALRDIYELIRNDGFDIYTDRLAWIYIIFYFGKSCEIRRQLNKDSIVFN